MKNVYISPQFNDPDAGDGGIRRVVEAMARYLPDYGWQVVDDMEQADLINCHAAALIDYPPDVPMVASCHGLYWSNYTWPGEMLDANQVVIETMARAQHVTAPSRWVARALSYGLLKPITPIHHGVDVEDWKPSGKGNYVLWNKARSDVISNPDDLMQLAKLMPDVPFLTTIGKETQNVKVTGRVSYGTMKALVENAAVYLATARETFGIGTLEALACGVPVVGWAFGGQEEIIIGGKTGYLVPYGDYEALAQAVRKALKNRTRLSRNARQDAGKRWGWPDKIAQYVKIFDDVYEAWHKPRPTVSIIVTCHNLGKYLDVCLESVTRTELTGWECIIVDDDSADDTPEIAQRWVDRDDRFKYIRPDRNLGLSGARNFGVAHSAGRYIFPLDADDILLPDGLNPLVKLLNENHGVHIAYGNLRMLNDDGTQQAKDISSPGADFDWLSQMSHLNQMYYCPLMRREVLENSGGYRVRDWRAEDAAFWCRATSFGFRAKKATEKPIILYRIRSDSKSQQERQAHADADGDWTAWYGWRVAGSHGSGRKARARQVVPNPSIVPFGAQGKPPSDTKSWNTDHRQNPLISIIIPVGPGHDRFLVDSLDSCMAQTFGSWEAVVVNDTGSGIDLTPWPWARLVETEGATGAGAARNAGIDAAQGELVYFLDADDWMLGNCLQTMLAAWAHHDGQHYIYTNYMSVDQNGKVKHEKLRPYNQKDWRGQHAVNVLMGREDALKIGKFDEDLPGWEDWDYQLKLAVNGICGVFVPVETFVYRFHSGQRRQTAADSMKELLPQIKARFEDYYTGAKELMSCGCGNAGQSIIRAKQALKTYQPAQAERPVSKSNAVRMEFTGQGAGTRTFNRVGGKSLTRVYRGGNNTIWKYIDADPADVNLLLQTGLWGVVERAGEADLGEGANVPAPKPINYEEAVLA